MSPRAKPSTAQTSCFGQSPKADPEKNVLSRVVSGRLLKTNRTTVNASKQEISTTTTAKTEATNVNAATTLGFFKKKEVMVEPLKMGLITRGLPNTPQVKTVRSPRAFEQPISTRIKYVTNAGLNKTMRVNTGDLTISRMLDYEPKYIALEGRR